MKALKANFVCIVLSLNIYIINHTGEHE